MSYLARDSRETCPYCGNTDCEADWTDVGVGLVQSGPYVCDRCGASSIGLYDKNQPDEDEKKTGWWKPGRFGSSANVFNGVHIDVSTAKVLYRLGLLTPENRKDQNVQDYNRGSG